MDATLRKHVKYLSGKKCEQITENKLSTMLRKRKKAAIKQH